MPGNSLRGGWGSPGLEEPPQVLPRWSFVTGMGKTGSCRGMGRAMGFRGKKTWVGTSAWPLGSCTK